MVHTQLESLWFSWLFSSSRNVISRSLVQIFVEHRVWISSLDEKLFVIKFNLILNGTLGRFTFNLMKLTRLTRDWYANNLSKTFSYTEIDVKPIYNVLTEIILFAKDCWNCILLYKYLILVGLILKLFSG